MKLYSSPSGDGYRMPGEFEQHKGTVMIWPVRPGSWPYGGREAKETFAFIAKNIAKYEKMYMLADREHVEEARQMLEADGESLIVLEIPTNDSWARDVGPTCVIKESEGHICEASEEAYQVRGIDWGFNAWGGDFDGLYKDYDLDNKAASAICNQLSMDYYDSQDFILEGGSIHSDGQGTVIVTESCLLSKGRNPKMSKEQITEKLKDMLGAKKVIWLPFGIYNDETNEHVDNVCAFTAPGEVVLAWTEDEKDPQYAMSAADLAVLENETDAKGRKIKVHKLNIPKKPVCITEQELAGFEFAEGEDFREAGERLAASYVNFYICNGAVLVPQFGDENDKAALDLLASLFGDRKVIGVPARSIIVGGGNIHCITQQIF